MISTFYTHERPKAIHERKLPSLYTWVSVAVTGPTYMQYTHTVHTHETDPLAGPHEITWLSG